MEVREMGESHGLGSFTVRSFRAGETLLEEMPFAFAPSAASRESMRCCKACGRIMATMYEECERLAKHIEDTLTGEVVADKEETEDEEGLWRIMASSPTVFYSYLKDFETEPEFTAEESFCGTDCRTRWVRSGGRFLREGPSKPDAIEDEEEEEDDDDSEESGAAVGGDPRSSAQTLEWCIDHVSLVNAAVMRASWPRRSDALAAFMELADRFDAQLRLLAVLFARFLHDVLSAGGEGVTPVTDPNPNAVAMGFAAEVERFVSRYAEGASRPLSAEQRALLRLAWKLSGHWLSRTVAEERRATPADPTVWMPLQLFLRCHWAVDANVHEYYVASPLYTLLVRRQEAGERRMELIEAIFDRVSAAAAHAKGVALYDKATKINHSCAPSARFAPVHGGVRAVVVALCDIAVGSEVRSSYIDVNAFESTTARRDYLRRNYGFDCDCPRCAAGE